MHRYNRATTKYKDVPNEEKFLIALDKIDVEYFIVKRKL